jgi:hypothetical protein
MKEGQEVTLTDGRKGYIARVHKIGKRINGYKIQLNTGAVAFVKPEEIKQ